MIREEERDSEAKEHKCFVYSRVAKSVYDATQVRILFEVRSLFALVMMLFCLIFEIKIGGTLPRYQLRRG